MNKVKRALDCPYRDEALHHTGICQPDFGCTKPKIGGGFVCWLSLYECPVCNKLVSTSTIEFRCGAHYSCHTEIDYKYVNLVSCDECGTFFRLVV